jgi:hypothetical protein
VSNRETAFGNLSALADVSIFGPEFAVRLTGLQINSPELTPIDFGNERAAESGEQTAQNEIHDQVVIGFAPANNRVVYQASNTDGDTPSLSLAVNNPNGADYSFRIDKIALNPEESVALWFDPTTNRVSVENNDAANNSYSVAVVRTESNGNQNTYEGQFSDNDGVGVTINVGSDWDGTTPPAAEPVQTPTLPQIRRTYYLPIVAVAPHGPDLVLDNLVATPSDLQIVIRNQGDRPVNNAFWVDAYLDPTIPPTAVNQQWIDIASQGIVWGVTEAMLPIAPGGSIILRLADNAAAYSSFPDIFPVGTPVYVQVDSFNPATSYGAVWEQHEMVNGFYNNVAMTVVVDQSTQIGLFPSTWMEGGAGMGVDSLPSR